MPLLTLFTAPKPFTNPHINIIQRNALQSWLHLGQDVDVLMFGHETGMDEVAAEYGVRHFPEVACSETGAPLINAMFETARQASDAPLQMIINADILVMPDLVGACRQMLGLAERFLLFGSRWDLDLRTPLDFSNGWVDRLKSLIKTDGKLHPPLGSDYFVAPRSCFTDIPPFAIGRSGWDNWMIYHALEQGMPAVDLSPTALVIHQNHDYSHLPGNKPPYHMEESNRNRTLAGGKQHLYLILDTTTELRGGQLCTPKMTTPRLLRRVELSLYPKEGHPSGLRRMMIRQLRRMRRDVTE